MTTTYKFKVAYTSSGVGYAPTPAPTITIVDASNNVLVNAAATTALSNMTGVYIYNYTGADELDLIGRFSTTDANVDDKQLFSYTPDIITTNLDAKISSRASSADILGPGAAEYEITINDDNGNPLDGVRVWITTDAAGNNVIFNGVTDTLGKVTPMLDAGSYYAWKQLAGYTFTNPESFTAP